MTCDTFRLRHWCISPINSVCLCLFLCQFYILSPFWSRIDACLIFSVYLYVAHCLVSSVCSLSDLGLCLTSTSQSFCSFLYNLINSLSCIRYTNISSFLWVFLIKATVETDLWHFFFFEYFRNSSNQLKKRKPFPINCFSPSPHLSPQWHHWPIGYHRGHQSWTEGLRRRNINWVKKQKTKKHEVFKKERISDT